ncbi:hypothetical protein GPECTOR_104g85 [Gonium pectorale]|uniref:P/Homo B domain-containing protein n=1 Tax=Gonium pectorale TaxID=33097 RepID=A0A150FZR1_GONPE|nr:hypothetical protein GPECTOR_104g85 [Gonium pectorale]|eukprot:KXZ43079.1 hypothetical protein GPECTOR_104g85 [Gonium pectorale]
MGTVTYLDTHQGGAARQWYLQDSGSLAQPYYRLPGQPVDEGTGVPIPPGKDAQLVCVLADTGSPYNLQCSAIRDVAQALRASVSIASAGRNPAVGVTIRLLVVVLKVDDAGFAPADPELVRRAYLENNLNDGMRFGHAEKLEVCSYGQMKYDRDALQVVEATISKMGNFLNCTGGPCVDDCEPGFMANEARNKLLAERGRDFAGGFTHTTYVIPGGAPACDWAGVAAPGGTESWLQPDTSGLLNEYTALHEILHNFHLAHGWKNGEEGEDDSTCMGRGNGCPSAPELYRLGWADPIATLNGSTLPEDSTWRGPYTLLATYMPTRGNKMLRVLPDWMGADYKRNVYFGLRMMGGGDWDTRVAPYYFGKVIFHTMDATRDNAMDTGDPTITLVDAIEPLTPVYDIPEYRLAVRTSALNRTVKSIALQVCRYRVQAADCRFAAPAPKPPVPTIDAALTQPCAPAAQATLAGLVNPKPVAAVTESPFPAATQPDTTQPAFAQPDATNPATAQTATAQPDATNPATAQTATAQPTTAQPATAQTATAQPTTAHDRHRPARHRPALCNATSSGPAFNIPDKSTANRTVAMLPCGQRIASVTVTLDIAHSSTGDLRISLISPAGCLARFEGPQLVIPDKLTVNTRADVIMCGRPVGSVTLNITMQHPYLGDLRITLIAPDGTTSALVASRPASDAKLPYGAYLFADAAPATPAFPGLVRNVGQSGAYRPRQAFSAFAGRVTEGRWTVQFVDTASGNTGSVASWVLTV